MIAAAENRSRIVDQLLAAGADPNRRSSGGRLAGERGQTALHHAARNRNTGMIESLIGAGASPNVLDLQRRPQLAESVDARHVAGIELLYARGASPSLLPTGELEALRRLARQYGLTQITAAVGR